MSQPVTLLVGGTFDPVHVGHLELMREAVTALRPDEVVVVVTDGRCDRARPEITRRERARLVRIAVHADAALSSLCAVRSDATLLTAAQERHRVGGRVHAVFGADSARRLSRWDAESELAKLATLWVTPRGGDDGRGVPASCQLHAQIKDVSSTEVRAALRRGPEHLGPLVPPACRDAIAALYGGSPHASVGCQL
jgi:nicotinate-nucleotide adenylyltransferase